MNLRTGCFRTRQPRARKRPMIGFEYPTSPHSRRHGPAGYRDYGSYRDWLRDEFTFRCVYCLHREQWNNRGGSVSCGALRPDQRGSGWRVRILESSLRMRNLQRDEASHSWPSEPCQVAFNDCLRIMADGRIKALNADGEKLNQVLRLDSEKNVRDRYRWMRALEALRTTDPELYGEYMGFPRICRTSGLSKHHTTRGLRGQ